MSQRGGGRDAEWGFGAEDEEAKGFHEDQGDVDGVGDDDVPAAGGNTAFAEVEGDERKACRMSSSSTDVAAGDEIDACDDDNDDDDELMLTDLSARPSSLPRPSRLQALPARPRSESSGAAIQNISSTGCRPSQRRAKAVCC